MTYIFATLQHVGHAVAARDDFQEVRFWPSMAAAVGSIGLMVFALAWAGWCTYEYVTGLFS
jgi:hypothetical protein